ncbi:amidohydrolase [Advenella alkanexedens]|uniref:Amidohydrolase n=1 Tax=Advenella alkanexedens TaxID=1481665 RepID=A0ABS6NLH8_9BURK|nr:amidohydrolase family protein [Advenella alkanexedens]MBV4396473.1 amidohydrolase [Advenella alkanexedens]
MNQQEGLKHASVIDMHAHIVLAETMGAAGDYGPFLGKYPDNTPYFQIGKTYRLNGVKYEGSPFMDVDCRLEKMAESGIDYQVLSPNPLTYFHFIPAQEAIRFCRIHNDAVARLVGNNSQKLGAFAALPMQDPKAASEELKRAVNELNLMGAGFGTDMPLRLHDPAMDIVYETAAELGVPLYIHPSPAGIDGPEGDPVLRHFELDIVAGFTCQETLAIGSLVYGGVLERHENLKICISHGGGAVAMTRYRMAQAARKRPWSPASLRETGNFEAMLKRLWVDTHIGHPKGIELLSETFGADHLVYGTNFAGWDMPDNLDSHALPGFLADNARKLLCRT